MSDKTASSKERVLQVWPDATVWSGYPYRSKYRVMTIPNDPQAQENWHPPLGFGATPEAAWDDAANKIIDAKHQRQLRECADEVIGTGIPGDRYTPFNLSGTMCPPDPEMINEQLEMDAEAQTAATRLPTSGPEPQKEEAGEEEPVNLREMFDLRALVRNFSEALLEKLKASERKYEWKGGWKNIDWQDDLRRDIRNHVEKGDPLDVAAYCAFALHHGWSLSGPPVAPEGKDGLFYIQDTRSYEGNSAFWWRENGHGYTSNIDEAWKVPATWRGRDTDKLWPCAEIDKRTNRQFDMQLFREITEAPHAK